MGKKPFVMVNDCFVIDTNVLVSGLVFNSQKPIASIKHCLTIGHLFISNEVLDEYKAKLLANKFDLFVPRETREVALAGFVKGCEFVKPIEKIEICRDVNDNKLLELALAANARCIITGDKDLLVLNPFRGISIVTPSDFLQLTYPK